MFRFVTDDKKNLIIVEVRTWDHLFDSNKNNVAKLIKFLFNEPEKWNITISKKNSKAVGIFSGFRILIDGYSVTIFDSRDEKEEIALEFKIVGNSRNTSLSVLTADAEWI